jgi:hypothetical protein
MDLREQSYPMHSEKPHRIPDSYFVTEDPCSMVLTSWYNNRREQGYVSKLKAPPEYHSFVWPVGTPKSAQGVLGRLHDIFNHPKSALKRTGRQRCVAINTGVSAPHYDRPSERGAHGPLLA